MTQHLPYSILDLSPVPEGSTAQDAIRNTIDLAQRAEGWGYHRFWLAEHHNMPGIASAATAVLIGLVAQATKTIRVGAGGIMLPNHAPLIIAEQFGTLESLYPGRVDLGLGRAPGTDQAAAQAMRRTLTSDPNRFANDVVELAGYFAGEGGRERLPRGLRAVRVDQQETPRVLGLGRADQAPDRSLGGVGALALQGGDRARRGPCGTGGGDRDRREHPVSTLRHGEPSRPGVLP